MATMIPRRPAGRVGNPFDPETVDFRRQGRLLSGGRADRQEAYRLMVRAGFTPDWADHRVREAGRARARRHATLAFAAAALAFSGAAAQRLDVLPSFAAVSAAASSMAWGVGDAP